MAYTLRLTDGELASLAWAADRYTSAQVLYDGLEATDEDGAFTIPEHVAWDYCAELETENGCGMAVPPCIGGDLAEKLLELRESVVS